MSPYAGKVIQPRAWMRLHWSILLIMMLIPVSVRSQIPGKVIDAHSRLPLENVRIELNGGPSIFTDAAGMFFLPPSDKGDTLTLSHLGYLTRDHAIHDRQSPVIELFPDPEQLETVTISASAFSGKLRNQTGSMNLLLARSARLRSQEHISGWLNEVPGLYMHSGGYNTNRMIIRGIGSREPYGSNRIKAYLNDIPLTGGDGVTVIEDLSLSGIQRVEILKGPSSAVYGAGLGGTLRMFTPYPGKRGFAVNTLHEAGSFGLFKHGAALTYKEGPAALLLDIGRQQSNGFRENSHYHNNHLLFTGDVFLQKVQLGFLFNFIDLKAFIPSSLNDSMYRNDPGAAAPNWLAIRGFEEYDKYIAGLSIESPLGKVLSMKTTVFGGKKSLYESRPFNILENETSNYGIRTHFKYGHAAFQALAGAELYTERIGWKTFETIGGIKGQARDDINEQRQYANFFNLYRWQPGAAWNLEGGWNLGWVSYELLQSSNPDYPAGRYRFLPDWSPRIGVNYQPLRHLWIFGSAGKGFSTPSFEETLLPEGIRNETLRPEKGWNLDLGLRTDLLEGRLHLDFTAYVIFVRDLLVTERISEEIFTGINAGRSLHKGLESGIRWNFVGNPRSNHQLVLYQNIDAAFYRFVDFVDEGADYAGNHLPGIPSYKSSTRIRWAGPSNLASMISLMATGRQYLADDNLGTYPGYQKVDWSFSWSPEITNRLGISATIGIGNLFDQSYASMILINAPSFGNRPPRYYYPGKPRNVYLQLRFRINA